MNDFFSLLNFPRTPWLDPAEVQARFLELSARAHPDRVHNFGAAEVASATEKFGDLNAAAAALREPKERLNHLLALETGTASNAAQNIPAEFIDLFTRIGQTCRAVDQFLAERSRATSPIMQAQIFGQGLEWSDRIGELQAEVGAVKKRAEEDLQRIAQRWPQEKPLDEVRGLAHIFATTARWEAQLKERFSALAAM